MRRHTCVLFIAPEPRLAGTSVSRQMLPYGGHSRRSGSGRQPAATLTIMLLNICVRTGPSRAAPKIALLAPRLRGLARRPHRAHAHVKAVGVRGDDPARVRWQHAPQIDLCRPLKPRKSSTDLRARER